MTGQPISDSGTPVGRPPIKRNVATKPILVRMDEHMHARIEERVGKKRMAAFIREAVEEKLAATEGLTSRKPNPLSPDTKGEGE